MYESKECTSVLQLAKIHYMKQEYNKALEVLKKIQTDGLIPIKASPQSTQ